MVRFHGPRLRVRAPGPVERLLHIGVVRGGEGELEGHAWVESDGRVLIGGTASEIGQFTRLAAFGVETVFGQRSVGTLQEGR